MDLAAILRFSLLGGVFSSLPTDLARPERTFLPLSKKKMKIADTIKTPEEFNKGQG
jgi:hypothetical protein